MCLTILIRLTQRKEQKPYTIWASQSQRQSNNSPKNELIVHAINPFDCGQIVINNRPVAFHHFSFSSRYHIVFLCLEQQTANSPNCIPKWAKPQSKIVWHESETNNHLHWSKFTIMSGNEYVKEKNSKKNKYEIMSMVWTMWMISAHEICVSVGMSGIRLGWQLKWSSINWSRDLSYKSHDML